MNYKRYKHRHCDSSVEEVEVTATAATYWALLWPFQIGSGAILSAHLEDSDWQRAVGTLNWAGGCRLDVDAAGVEAAAMSCGREGRWCTALALKSTALQGSEAEKIREGSDYAGRWFETA